MPVFSWAGFEGENRAMQPKLLPDTVGTLSRNQKPGRGDLRPWKQPSSVASVPAGTQTIYRMGRDVASDSSYWLSWPTIVHAVRGFDSDDTTERTYYTGDGAPKVTDNTIALASTPYPTAWRPLGVPAPIGAPTVTTDSGTWTGTNTTNAFVYTYVNDWGWESAPSPPSSLLTRPNDSTATITNFSAVPAGNYHITAIRIYKSASGTTTDGFYFHREIAIGTAATTDDNRDLGELLPTAAWLTPPSDLTWLTAMWNGMMAGISGNAVRFCEPFTHYAWPIAYDALPADAKPVALGVVGQQLLVLTTGRPLLVAGSSPDSLDQIPLEFNQACVAPRSVVSLGYGVAWASEDGLCLYTSDGPRILTAGVMLREDWQALNPSSIVGCLYEGRYIGSFDDGTGRKGFVIDPTNPKGMYFLDTGYSAMLFDTLRDGLYVLDGTDVKKWDSGSAMTVKAKSKLFYSPRPINFAAAEVIADAYPLTFRFYADGSLCHTQTVTGQNPFRLPANYLAQSFQLEIESAFPVLEVNVGTSVAELASV